MSYNLLHKIIVILFLRLKILINYWRLILLNIGYIKKEIKQTELSIKKSIVSFRMILNFIFDWMVDIFNKVFSIIYFIICEISNIFYHRSDN